MLNRIFFFLAFSLPLGAFAQTQFSILDIPVCWNDSSIIKYTYVTASGAYLDLGYYSPGGQPVTVSGGTLKTGFCATPAPISDTLSIDSAGRSFTISLGDQDVSFNAGAEYLAQLLDVDTAGLDSNYIIKYSPSAGEWLVFDNNVNGLSDGYFQNRNLYLIGFKPDSLTTGIANSNFGFAAGWENTTGQENVNIGDVAGYWNRTGSFNTNAGRRSGVYNYTGSYNSNFGAYANAQDTLGGYNVNIGAYANSNAAFGQDTFALPGYTQKDSVVAIGAYARSLNTISVNEVVIGAFTIGNGSNSATLGNTNIDSTFLRGDIHLTGYGLGNKEAADLSKTSTDYVLRPASDGTILEQVNNIDGLTDATKDLNGNLITGYVNVDTLANYMTGFQNTLYGNAFSRLKTGSRNTGVGFTVAPWNHSGNDNFYGGYLINWLDTIGSRSVLIGNEVNKRIDFNFDTLGTYIVNDGVFIGYKVKSLNGLSVYETAIGSNVTGNGDSTATIGQTFLKGTYLNGTMNFNGYGSGNKTASALLKTRSAYLAAYATDGTLIEVDTSAISPGGITQITGFNGLTDVGADSVKLGGTLTENTAINMDSFEIAYTNNGGTFISGDGNIGFTANTTSAGNSTFAMGSLGTRFSNDYGDSLALHTVNLASIRSGVRELDLRSEKSNDNDVYTMIALSPERFAMKTPNVVNLTATPGMFLKLVNQATGQVEFDTISGGGGGGGFDLPTDSITFNDNTGAAVAGKLQRDDNTGTLVYGSPTGTELRLQPPGWYVKNQTGATIPRGTVVRAAGTVGNSDQILIDKMIADGSIEGKFLLGVTAENIADGADGWVFSQGKIKPVDLSAYNSGEVLYVSTTVPGAFTDTLPTAPDLVLPLGFVVDSTSNGTLAVRVTFNPTVTATNGLTATPGADNTQVKLGGDLTEATKIDGTHTYGLWLDSLSFLNAYARGDIRLRADSTTFGTNSALTFDEFTGASLTNFGSTNQYLSSLNLLRSGELSLKQARNFGGVNRESGFRINAADATAEFFSEDKDTPAVLTRLRLQPDKVNLVTPNVANSGAASGMFLKLIDATTGEIDFDTIPNGENDAMVIACSDETTALTAGKKVTFRAPFAMQVEAVKASLTTASSSGNPVVDINKGGVSILGTKLSIDAGETTSVTAASQATITTATLEADAEITIDIDTPGASAAGLKVTIIYRK